MTQTTAQNHSPLDLALAQPSSENGIRGLGLRPEDKLSWDLKETEAEGGESFELAHSKARMLGKISSTQTVFDDNHSLSSAGNPVFKFILSNMIFSLTNFNGEQWSWELGLNTWEYRNRLLTLSNYLEMNIGKLYKIVDSWV